MKAEIDTVPFSPRHYEYLVVTVPYLSTGKIKMALSFFFPALEWNGLMLLSPDFGGGVLELLQFLGSAQSLLCPQMMSKKAGVT